MHLWEVTHPYYCSEVNCYSNETYTKHASLADFLSEFQDSDMDYNLVFRWDWREGEDWEAGEFNGDPYYRNGRLMLFFMQQRRGAFVCHEVSVCRADEPAVMEFLKPRWEHMKTLWAPLSTEEDDHVKGD